jgi:quercetin dioxygenase-like cupin family protein
MRDHILPVLALLAAVGCRDAAATSPSASSHSGRGARASGTADIEIPAPNGFVSTALSRGSFTDPIDAMFKIKMHGGTTVVHVDDPTQMVMAKITIAPRGALPWHTHPGPALVTDASGEITIVNGEGCGVHRYAAGSSFMDAGQGHVHTGFNAGSTEIVVYVTYLDVPVGQSPLVPVENPGC